MARYIGGVSEEISSKGVLRGGRVRADMRAGERAGVRADVRAGERAGVRAGVS